MTLHFLDPDDRGRSEQAQVINQTTGAALDTRTASPFSGGVFLN